MEHTLAVFLAVSLVAGCLLQINCSSVTHYRLPVAIQPDSYHLKIVTHLDSAANYTFDGQVSIRFQALEDTNNITLHAKNLTIDESRIQLKSYADEDFHLCLEGIDKLPGQDFLVIRLCQPLQTGHMYNLTLYFSSILRKQMLGYFRSSYADEATNETRWISATQFEPSSARAAFPCFDEPIYKAKFTIWLGHAKSYTALSNMPLQQQIPLDGLDDYVWSVFEESVPMSTYLVAYTVNDFAYKESRVVGSDVVFRTWSRPDYIDQCDYAAEVGPKLLKYYEKVFGIPFPLKKVDEIALPRLGAAGMENWGLITYRDDKLLVPPDASFQLDNLETVRIIAHELAHQWFGNLVTMKWWNDLWLNEGFATYMGSLGAHNLYPQYDIYNTDSLSNVMGIFRSDAKLDSLPISQPVVNKNDKILQRFGDITYRKGSAVLRMIHMVLGHDEFFEGVHDYLSKHKYNNVDQDDLWAAFTEKARKFKRIEPHFDMKTFMDSWTLQSGYPLVNVSRNYETGNIEITQQRFLENSTIPEEEAKKCWWVPLSYTTAADLDFTTTSPKTWLECDGSSKSVPLKLENLTEANEWIIFNIQLSGVYRVMYDSDNWRLIGNTLKSDGFVEIHAMNRIQIIGDVTSFAFHGYLGYDVAFDILQYLVREVEYLPWKTALNALGEVRKKLKPFPEYQTYLNAYLRYIIEPIYTSLGGLNYTAYSDTSLMPIQSSFKQKIVEWACLAELDDCVHTAFNYFQQWKLSKNPDEELNIPDEIKGNIYRTVMRLGDEDDWSFLWQRLNATNVSSEKINILNALGCARNDSVLRDYLDLIFDKENGMDRAAITRAFYSLALCGNGSHIVLDYMVEHIARIHDDIKLDNAINTLSLTISSTQERDKLLNLIDSNKEYIKDSEKCAQYVMEKSDSNIQWTNRNLENVKTNLQTRLYAMGILKGVVEE